MGTPYGFTCLTVKGGGARPSLPCATLLAMRVVIANAHRLVLDGIKRALESDDDFEIVGETRWGHRYSRWSAMRNRTLSSRRAHAPHGRPRLPGRDQRRHPDVKVVMLCASTSADLVEAASGGAPPPTS